MGDESYALEDGADYILGGEDEDFTCERSKCDGCLAYDFCMLREEMEDRS